VHDDDPVAYALGVDAFDRTAFARPRAAP